MARIDVTQIDGYETMTAEEKLAALENFDMPDPDYSGWVRKDLYDKATSDLSRLKKESKTKLTDSEQAMADMRSQFEQENAGLKQQMEAMQTTLDGYKREKDIANLTAQYTKLGYGDLAEATATAFLDGDNDTVFKNQQAVMDARIEAAKQSTIADKTKQTPVPPAGNPKDNKDDKLDDFTKGFMMG